MLDSDVLPLTFRDVLAQRLQDGGHQRFHVTLDLVGELALDGLQELFLVHFPTGTRLGSQPSQYMPRTSKGSRAARSAHSSTVSLSRNACRTARSAS